MRVQAAEVHQASQHEVSRTQTQVMRAEGARTQPAVAPVPADAVQLSPAAYEIEAEYRQYPIEKEQLAPQHEVRIELAKRLVGRLLGARFKLVRPSDFVSDTGGQPEIAKAAAPPIPATQPPDNGIEFSYYSYHSDAAAVSFAATGVVDTTDGQRIDVDLELTMQRSFVAEHGINVRAGDAALKDPINVSFEGRASELTERRFKFDLDADGTKEQIALINDGGVATNLDRNHNGKVDDSTEIVGAITGDGFSELARYDDEGGLIAASDKVYDRLRLWAVGEDGDRGLMALGDRNLGAVYVGHVPAASEVQPDRVDPTGSVREGSFFAHKENAASGVDHVDLVA